MSTASLCIVVINWNASQRTLDCVEPITQWRSGLADVVIVDNGSHPDQLAVLASIENTVVLALGSNCGFSGANNQGVKYALSHGYEYIMLLNNDATISENDTGILLRAMSNNQDIGVIGPVLFDAATGAVQNAGGYDIGLHYHSHMRGVLHERDPYEVDYVSGTVFLARAKVFSQFGLLDERFFFSGEIADFCARIANLTMVHPRARATHQPDLASASRDTIYTYFSVRNRYLFIRKHHKWRLPILFCRWLFWHSSHALHAWREKQYQQARHVVLGIWHGCIGRYGKQVVD